MKCLTEQRLLIGLIVLLTLVSGCGSAPQVSMLSPNDYRTQFSTGSHLLLDVRTPSEYSEAHIDGSVNIALQDLNTRLSEIPHDQPVVIYCRSGNRSAQAAQLLIDAGYTQIYDMGGIIGWEQAGLPVVR
ncbi:MAG: rhodanese-like domain-containing protein [Anaerolineae bacterium]|jgi:rhodanese-related sulfurtransferase|nr:rhodanese-like domain-containing protein [Anaerolineae bacterium]